MSSLHRRIASRLRFRDYTKNFRDGSRPALSSSAELPPPKHRSLARLYRELYGLLAGYRSAIALALLGLTMASLLKLIPPAGDQGGHRLRHRWHGRCRHGSWRGARFALPASPKARLIVVVALVFVVSVLGKILALTSRWRATKATKNVQVAVRRKVYEHAMRLPLHRVYQLKSGGASSLLREDAGGVGELIFSMIYNPWHALIQFLGGLVVLAFIEWRLLCCALVLVPGVYYSDLIWNRRIRPLFRDVRKKRQDIDSQTTEVFGGMRVVRAFGRQKSESARFMGENHFMVRLELYVWWLSRLIELLWEFVLPMASVALLLYGGMEVIDGRLSLGDLMMFLVYLAMLLEPMAVLASSVTQFQNNLAGFDRVLDLLAEPREMADCPGTRSVSKSRRRRPDHTAQCRLRLSWDQPTGTARHQPRDRAR